MREIGRVRSWAGVVAIAAGMCGGAGCDALNGYPVQTVINGAHHAARTEDGKLPNYGDPENPRIFTTDTGWLVTLSEGFVVTTSARMVTCDGEDVTLGLPFGPFPEYFLDQDLNVTDFAALDLEPDEYCTLIVEYGRYQREVAKMAPDEPFPIEELDRIEGATIFLAGYADKPDGKGGMITKNFGFRSDQTVRVDLDLRELDEGTPWRIKGDEPGMRSLTVIKTYDEFFRGIDFENLDQAAIEADLPKRLAAQTRVVSGTNVY